MDHQQDLFELLMANQSQPQGSYDHHSWQVLGHGQAASEQAMIVSVHESMHHLLNNTSAYGLRLMVLAQLVKQQAVAESVLIDQVVACRTVHEVWATCSSLLMVSPQWFDEAIFEQLYPGYGQYVAIGKQILAGIEGYHLCYPLLNACIRVCMQSASLLTQLSEKNLFALDYADTPNRRLNNLLKLLNQTFWRQVLDDFYSFHNTDKAVQSYLALPSGTNMSVIEQGESDYDRVLVLLADFAYRAIDNLVGKQDTLPLDGHLQYIESLIRQVDEHYSDFGGADLVKADEREVSGLSQFESEAVVFDQIARPAAIVELSEFSAQDWPLLLSKTDKVEYLYISSRITERLLEQYMFSESDADKLRLRYPDFVNAIVLRQPLERFEDEFALLFVVIERPKQLEALGEQYSMLANVSLLLFSDSLWQQWYDILRAHANVTLLLDLPPSRHLSYLLAYDQVFYHLYYLDTDALNSVHLTLVCMEEGRVGTIVFVPCGLVTGHLLIDYMRQQSPIFKPWDIEASGNAELVWLCRLVMSRLADECRFDFKALESNYGQRALAAGRFD